MRGRKPLPRNLKLVTGAVRKDRDNPDEPILEVKIPDPPAHLTDTERDVFVNMAGKLARMRVMTEADADALGFYAERWCTWLEAKENIAQTGLLTRSPNGFPMPNPYVSIMNKAQADCMKILIEFGMTPSSRTRVKAQ